MRPWHIAIANSVYSKHRARDLHRMMKTERIWLNVRYYRKKKFGSFIGEKSNEKRLNVEFWSENIWTKLREKLLMRIKRCCWDARSGLAYVVMSFMWLECYTYAHRTHTNTPIFCFWLLCLFKYLVVWFGSGYVGLCFMYLLIGA